MSAETWQEASVRPTINGFAYVKQDWKMEKPLDFNKAADAMWLKLVFQQ